LITAKRRERDQALSRAGHRDIEASLTAIAIERPEAHPDSTCLIRPVAHREEPRKRAGDERDTVIFSVGYGPDQAGRIWMSFGLSMAMAVSDASMSR